MKQKNQKDNLWSLRHTCEHILTQAMENLWPGKIIKAMGPATDEGFYFDFDPSPPAGGSDGEGTNLKYYKYTNTTFALKFPMSFY